METPQSFSRMEPRHGFALLAAGLLVLVLMASVFPAFSQTRYNMSAYMRCSRDEGILKAFQVLEDSLGEPSLAKIVSKPMRVIFKDMRTLNKGLKNYDALSWISYQG